MGTDMRQCWETPPDLFATLEDEFRFTLDCAANQSNSKCSWCILEDQDALADRRWIDYIPMGVLRSYFLNPGFSNPLPWCTRMNLEVERTPGSVGVMIGLIAPSTKWWGYCVAHCAEIRLLGGKRVQFIAPPGIKQTSNARENAVFVFRHRARHCGGEAQITTWDWTAGGSNHE